MTNATIPPLNDSDPISVILGGREQIFRICDDLEHIADQLKGKIDRGASRSVLHRLRQHLPILLRDEEALFEVLRSRNKDDDILAKCIELSLLDHQACTSWAYELDEPLASLSNGRPVLYANAFGYMLRGYFEGTRKHLHWEGAILFGKPITGLCSSDLDQIAKRLVRNRRPTETTGF